MIDRHHVEPLRAALAGEVILPADAAYEEWSQDLQCHARQATRGHRAVPQHGRRRGGGRLRPRVRAARRGAIGWPQRRGPERLRRRDPDRLERPEKIEVDAAARTARAGGGVLWGEFDAATQQHGLHTPGGRVTTTGVGGFTTGGGYGWTSSKHGLTCDNLLSAEVVLADGRVVTASEHENADLFWGIRGGGGNFGIVTEFEYRLHPLGPIVLAGLALWPIERAPEVVRAWRDYVDGAPDELSTACVVITAPPEPFVPESMQGQVALGMAAMYVGDPDAGAKVMQPLKDLRPAVDLIQPMPYTAFQAMIDPMAPKGFRSYWRGEYLQSLSDEAIDTFVQHAPALTAAGSPSRKSSSSASDRA